MSTYLFSFFFIFLKRISCCIKMSRSNIRFVLFIYNICCKRFWIVIGFLINWILRIRIISFISIITFSTNLGWIISTSITFIGLHPVLNCVSNCFHPFFSFSTRLIINCLCDNFNCVFFIWHWHWNKWYVN